LVRQQAGQHAEAITAFEQSLSRQPGAAEPLIALAKSQVAIGQSDVALQRVQSVLDAKPEHILALNLKGEILLGQKKYPEAEAMFEQVVELKPEWDVPYKNILKIKLVEEDEAAALAVIKKGFENSKDPRLGLVLASRYDQSGNSEQARQVYEKLLVQRPGFDIAANNLAMLLIRGEPDQIALDKALELVKGFELSENPYYLDTLGWIYLKRSEPEKAILVLERAFRIEERIPAISYHLGMAYQQLGRTAEAVERLEVATASESQFEGMEEAKALLQELQVTN
jgi:Flp pilus assembly protein TadD